MLHGADEAMNEQVRPALSKDLPRRSTWKGEEMSIRRYKFSARYSRANGSIRKDHLEIGPPEIGLCFPKALPSKQSPKIWESKKENPQMFP